MTRRNRDRRRGAAAAELAVLLPFLMFICVIATDWARLMYFTVTIDACARNGAMYAADQIARNQSPYASTSAAALAEAPSLVGTATVTSSTATDSAGNAAVVVTVTYPFTTITSFPGVPSSQTLSRSCQMRVVPLTTY